MTTLNLQFSNMNDATAFSDLKLRDIDFNLLGGNVLVSGVAKKKVSVYRLFLMVGGDTNLTFQDGVSVNLSGALPLLANGTIALDLSNVPWFQTSFGNDFVLNSTASVQVSGTLYYQQK